MIRQATVSRRRLLQAGGALFVVGVGAGTGASADEHEGEYEAVEEGAAAVRVAHLAPDAPNVDLYIDGEVILEDVSYGTISDYLSLEPGTYDVQVTPAGEEATEAVIDESVEVAEGEYTIAAVGEVADENQPLEALVIAGEEESLDSDTARLRVVHASPDAPAVDVVAGENGDPLVEELAFGEYETVDVPADEYPVAVYPAGDRSEAVAEMTVTLEGGMAYTAFATGYVDPANAPVDEPFEVLLAEDAIPSSDGRAEAHTKNKSA